MVEGNTDLNDNCLIKFHLCFGSIASCPSSSLQTERSYPTEDLQLWVGKTNMIDRLVLFAKCHIPGQQAYDPLDSPSSNKLSVINMIM